MPTKSDPPVNIARPSARNNETIRRVLLKGLITKMKNNRVTLEQAAKLLERWFFPQ